MVYNPASGKRRDQKAVLEKFFTDNNLKYDIYITKARNDGLEFVKTFEIDNYCALILVGGDGTLHEGINGLMQRADKKRVPMGWLPNGTGNDALYGFRIETFQQGLNALKKGNIVNIDLTKCTVDGKQVVYSFLNGSLCLGANVNRNAAGKKKCLGPGAYTLQTVIEIVKNRTEKFDMDIDNGKAVYNDLETSLIMIFNSKFGAGKVYINPLGMINDGYFEVTFSPTKMAPKGVADLFGGAKAGGIQVY